MLLSAAQNVGHEMCILVMAIPTSSLAFPQSLPNTPHGPIAGSTVVNGFNTNMHPAVFKFKGPHGKSRIQWIDRLRHLVV